MKYFFKRNDPLQAFVKALTAVILNGEFYCK